MASKTFLLIRRRLSNAVAAENMRGQRPAAAAASVMTKVTDFRARVCGVKKVEFWMRDPKTGYWVPESQFNQIDVADLREKLLPKKKVY